MKGSKKPMSKRKSIVPILETGVRSLQLLYAFIKVLLGFWRLF